MSSSNSEQARPPSDLLEVGRIERAHGLRGELVVSFVTNLASVRSEPGSVLWADGQALTVKSARPHKNRWLVQFDGVGDRDDADRMLGLVLHAPPLELETTSVGQDSVALGNFATEVVAFVHELIGLRLVDQHGTDHGEVVSLVENPAADLIELADGRLVPLTFHRSHDDERIVVEVPVGLLDGDDV